MYKKIRHSCYCLKYHLVLITKDMKPIIKNDLVLKLKEYIKYYFDNNKLKIIKYNNNSNYIHILFEGKPNLNLANFINGLKTLTSKNIRKEFQNELSLYYEKPSFWHNSYFVSIANAQSENIIKQYLKDQKIEL